MYEEEPRLHLPFVGGAVDVERHAHGCHGALLSSLGLRP
jgi:hypothetical protein